MLKQKQKQKHIYTCLIWWRKVPCATACLARIPAAEQRGLITSLWEEPQTSLLLRSLEWFVLELLCRRPDAHENDLHGPEGPQAASTLAGDLGWSWPRWPAELEASQTSSLFDRSALLLHIKLARAISNHSKARNGLRGSGPVGSGWMWVGYVGGL